MELKGDLVIIYRAKSIIHEMFESCFV